MRPRTLVAMVAAVLASVALLLWLRPDPATVWRTVKPSTAAVPPTVAAPPPTQAAPVKVPPSCPQLDRSLPLLATTPDVLKQLALESPPSCVASGASDARSAWLAPADHVVLASSSMARYSFFLPLTALVWRHRIGMEPFLLLVGSNFDGSPRMRVVLDFLAELERDDAGIRATRVPCAKADEIFVVQMIRLFAAALPVLHNDSWVVINDIDMWPLNPAMYRMGKREGKILSNNAGCCGRFTWRERSFVEFPMGSIGMTAAQWRAVMRLPALASDGEQQRSCLVEVIRARAKHMFGATISDFRGAHWRDDQYMISVHLQSGFASQMLPVGRGHDRMDREAWPQPHCLQALADAANDAHIPFPGYSFWENNLQLLFRALVPARFHERADRYVREFRAAPE